MPGRHLQAVMPPRRETEDVGRLENREVVARAVPHRQIRHLTLPAFDHRRLLALIAPRIQRRVIDQRQPHRALRVLMDELRGQGLALDTLSMGMSADLEAAVAEGATIVRVGTAIFGGRPAAQQPH